MKEVPGDLSRQIVEGSQEGVEVICLDESRDVIKILYDRPTATNPEVSQAEKVASQHSLDTGHNVQLREYVKGG